MPRPNYKLRRKHLQTALTYERAVMGVSQRGPREAPIESTAVNPCADAAAAAKAPVEGATAAAHGKIPTPDLSLVELARSTGRAQEPAIRQQLATLHCLRTVNDWNGVRAKAEVKSGGSSPVASLGKLAMAQILHYAGHVQATILGMEATLDGDSQPRARDHNYSQMNAYFFSIGGGTDQIQRNIIGERLLGLPREPEVDRDLAFKDVRAQG